MIAKIWNIRYWTNSTDERFLETELEATLREAGFSILKTIKHEFTPYGFTKLWLLGESHLAVHTFPEESKSYIELSSCVQDKYENFVKSIYKKSRLAPREKREEIESEVA